MKSNLEQTLNQYGKFKTPIFFIINYDLSEYEVIPLDKLENIAYEINAKTNKKTKKIELEKSPISFKEYKDKFDSIQKHIREGNSYLLNLTAPTKIKMEYSLKDIYENTNAKFKLLYKDKFVSFSPERFVKIDKNKIYTFPMKGTIDASVDFAEAKILADTKEIAEHTMVVDLLRNDLGIVGSNVKVEKFRYIDKIKAGDKELLQVSSKISAKLENNWQDRLGSIITSMLPAGSITGTPKKKTVQILKDVENYDRGFYTGIWGVFDGESLDSSVMIRFIENTKDGFIYKSGGGITCDSEVNSEYQELIDKVYLPS